MISNRDRKALERIPATIHMEAGAVGDIGEAWYAFLRGVLKASDVIDQRRAARLNSGSQSHSKSAEKEKAIQG